MCNISRSQQHSQIRKLHFCLCNAYNYKYKHKHAKVNTTFITHNYRYKTLKTPIYAHTHSFINFFLPSSSYLLIKNADCRRHKRTSISCHSSPRHPKSSSTFNDSVVKVRRQWVHVVMKYVCLFDCQLSLVVCVKPVLSLAYDTFRLLYNLIQSVPILL